MSFAALAAWRRLAGRAGCAFMLLLLAALVDGMVAGGLQDPNLRDVLPGQSVSLSEQLPRGAEKLDDVELRPSDPGIIVQMKETYSGFWMGGAIWRAEASLPPDLALGTYRVALFHHNGTAAAPPQVFTIRVHPDLRSIQAASGSLTTRSLGISPYLLALCLLGLATLPMAASFVLTRGIAQALREQGMAEVFRAMAPPRSAPLPPAAAQSEPQSAPQSESRPEPQPAPAGQHIYFSPAQGHTLTPGSLVDVLDEGARDVLGQAQVTGIEGKNVIASMQGGVQVRPGTLVKLPGRA